MYFSPLLDRAARFAAIAHRHQLRKSPEAEIPYIQHSYMVGLILLRAGFDEEVVAAGILHDVLEDTACGLEELRTAFGSRVAELVSSVSEQDKSLPWEVRKERYIEHLRTASEQSKAITAADKIHNINSIIVSLSHGADIWGTFKRGREAQLLRFDRMLAVIREGWDHPLVDELEEALARLKAPDEGPD